MYKESKPMLTPSELIEHLESKGIKFELINNVNTGNKIAAPTDPIDTILLIAIITIAKIRQIKPIFQFIIINTPSEVATPLPPLNSKKIGNVCPNYY